MLPTPPTPAPVPAVWFDNNQDSFGLEEAWASKGFKSGRVLLQDENSEQEWQHWFLDGKTKRIR